MNGSSFCILGRSIIIVFGSIIDYISSFGVVGIGISYIVIIINWIIIEWVNSIGVYLLGVYIGVFVSFLCVNGNIGCFGYISVGVSNIVIIINGLVSSRVRSGNSFSSWVECGSIVGDYILWIVVIVGGVWFGVGVLYIGSFSSIFVGVSDIIIVINGFVYGGVVLCRVNLLGVYIVIIKISIWCVIINICSFCKIGIEVGNFVVIVNRVYCIGVFVFIVFWCWKG